ncbi:hypothetical protein ACXZ7R_23060 [Vibrio campbellii]|uniref:hypothetical protein n=1 Tax=Vibrio campbellii TaxID=680 RepID=UPI0005314D92|nr:hypothetical protein [Vibrio campbellii]KGR36099.1 hypothetical protein OA39_01201 [Vibrio campbellii]MCR9911072.1 hypothetical protein [Vibrio campbellii]
MKTKLKIALLCNTLFFCSYSHAVPDAVCGNGLHVGNPHCTNYSISSSSAPMPNLSTSGTGAGILLSATLLGLYIRRRDLHNASEKELK